MLKSSQIPFYLPFQRNTMVKTQTLCMHITNATVSRVPQHQNDFVQFAISNSPLLGLPSQNLLKTSQAAWLRVLNLLLSLLALQWYWPQPTANWQVPRPNFALTQTNFAKSLSGWSWSHNVIPQWRIHSHLAPRSSTRWVEKFSMKLLSSVRISLQVSLFFLSWHLLSKLRRILAQLPQSTWHPCRHC